MLFFSSLSLFLASLRMREVASLRLMYVFSSFDPRLPMVLALFVEVSKRYGMGMARSDVCLLDDLTVEG